MSKTKNILVGGILLMSVFFSTMPRFAFATNPSTQTPGQFQGSEMEAQLNAFSGDKGGKLTYSDPRVLVARLIKTFLGVIGIIAVVLALYAGFIIMTSSGNEEKIETGKKILMYCVTGVAVILGAYSITYFIYMGLYDSINNPMSSGYTEPIQIQQN
ncbi:MAG TPA: pilin [Candidatus Magasanikbacteria bacterium]|nr:pilin [Candidatus Magasanikbacteria bacterium]